MADQGSNGLGPNDQSKQNSGPSSGSQGNTGNGMPDNSGTDGIANILNLMRQQQQEQQQERLRQQATNEQLARRMDQLAQMFNGMNTNLAPHRSLPNIAGLHTSMNMPPTSFPNPPPTYAAVGGLNPQAGAVSPSTNTPPTSTGLAITPGTATAPAAPTPRTATTATVAHATIPAVHAASAIAAAISAVPSMPNTGIHPLADTFYLPSMDDTNATTAVELISDDDRRKKLAEAQDADHIIREVKELVRKRKRPRNDFPIVFYKINFARLAIKDNILHRKDTCGSSNTPILQAIIPPNLISRALQDAHGSIFAGHPGYQRMVNILHRHVTWPGIYRDAKNHVTKCVECDRVSQPNPPAKTELKSTDLEFVFEHVCCDLIQLPHVPNGWKYICVFMDVFSRHVTFYKFKDKSTLSFARALEDYVTHVGCPQKLTCDNGAEFCSELVDAVTKVMGIKKKTSVVYRPQSQGMVERMNRQIIDQLTK